MKGDRTGAIELLVSRLPPIERLETLSRTQPELPADTELSQEEVEVLILLKRDQKKRTEVVSDSMPTIAQATGPRTSEGHKDSTVTNARGVFGLEQVPRGQVTFEVTHDDYAALRVSTKVEATGRADRAFAEGADVCVVKTAIRAPRKLLRRWARRMKHEPSRGEWALWQALRCSRLGVVLLRQVCFRDTSQIITRACRRNPRGARWTRGRSCSTRCNHQGRAHSRAPRRSHRP